MELKIIAGLYHGRKLLKFNDKNIKPSKNIVRNAIFNILNKNIC
ncbi:RsmD family RNA methyltransferase, partial [bacterium]|nr:RsmD family RNA methyltransferase [bacterium]